MCARRPLSGTPRTAVVSENRELQIVKRGHVGGRLPIIVEGEGGIADADVGLVTAEWRTRDADAAAEILTVGFQMLITQHPVDDLLISSDCSQFRKRSRTAA